MRARNAARARTFFVSDFVSVETKIENSASQAESCEFEPRRPLHFSQ
jgi:hypothetical protein